MIFGIRFKEEKKMNRFVSFTGGAGGHSIKFSKGGIAGYEPLKWLMALLLAALVTGCGGGGDPILGAPIAATLVDVIKPRVTVTVPATTTPGPTAGPAANAAITATFTEAMAPATIVSPAVSFTVVDTTTGGTNVAGTVTYVVASKTARFKPTLALTPGDTYTATITTAATDIAGNALAGNQAALPAASSYVWTFSPAVADAAAPTVTLTAPASADIGVAINASANATFSEAMDPATICGAANLTAECPVASFTLAPTATPGSPVTGVVTYDPVSFIATFNPTGNLLASTQYTATVTPAVTDLAANAIVGGAVPNPWNFTTGTGLAAGAIALGSASTFGIMATSAITCVPLCTINGDVSLDPGTSITGPPVVNGSTHINDTVSAQARLDLLAAYNAAKTLAPGTGPNALSAGADPGALFPAGVPPGTYTSGSTIIASTPMVLNAGGNANAVWVFQIGSSLTTGASVSLANGAQAKNVFWVPTNAATIGVGTIFHGTILAGDNVTAVSGSTINGRILAGAITAGTVALQSGTTVNVPLP